MIPRIFHQIWVGPAPFPDDFARYQQTWLDLNAGWELRFWTEENLPQDVRWPEVHDRMRIPAERSDILRLEILWRHGGVYLDADFECRQPLDPLIGDVDFFAAYLKPDRVNNAIVGAVPGHPIVDRALRELRPQAAYGLDKTYSGPLFLDALLKEYPDVTIFEPELFYPTTPEERERAVAVHHMARSWKDDVELKKTAAIAERRLHRLRRELARAERRRQIAERAAVELEAAQALRPERALLVRTPREALVFLKMRLYAPVAHRGRRRRKQLEERGLALRRLARARAAARPHLRPPAPSCAVLAIPRVFHRIQLGPPPDAVEELRLRGLWERWNPKWSTRVWTEETLPSGMRPEAYERLRSPRERSQIIRLELLARHGGVCVDGDMECRRPLEPLLEGASLVAAVTPTGIVDGALIGAVPGHRAIDDALARLQPRSFWSGGRGLPHPLLDAEALVAAPDAVVLPAEAFPPADAAGDDAVAIRHTPQDEDGRGWAAVLEAEAEVAELKRRVAAALAAADAAEARLDAARTHDSR